jgi:hypothetical protein
VEDPGGVADGATCVSSETDPKNCGRCGHDCQGGSCAGGVCQPVRLESAAGCAIALDATRVYWTIGDTADHVQLTSEPLSGGAPEAVADTAGSVTAIAVDGVSLYWSEATPSGSGPNAYSAFVKRVALSGGAPSMLAAFSLWPSAIAVQGANVYVTTRWVSTFDPADQTPRGAVMTFPIEGVPPPPWPRVSWRRAAWPSTRSASTGQNDRALAAPGAA